MSHADDRNELIEMEERWERATERAVIAERERAIWFNENSGAQSTLGRVRELLHQWEACGCRPVCWHPAAAKSLRAALGEA